MKINLLLTELEVLAIGWEKYAVDHTFSGYTLAQLKALIASLKELVAAMDALKLEYRGKIAARQSMGLELRDIRLRIVHCIRGHEDFGEDSEFYRFLGFKTKSERRSGLTRKTGEPTEAPTSDEDGVDLEDAAQPDAQPKPKPEPQGPATPARSALTEMFSDTKGTAKALASP